MSMEAVQVVPANQDIQRGLMIFSYEGIRLKESCWIDGKPYFTMRAIGEWLEYKNPEKAIFKIIHRNPHIKQFATPVNLTVVDEYTKGHSVPKLGTESSQRTREIEHEVFDPIGLQLIINKSNQPKAIAFQVAVAHLVYDYITGNLKPFKWSGDVSSALSQIISMSIGKKRKLKVLELAKEIGKSWNTVYTMANKLNGENLKTRAGKPKKTRKDKNSFCNLPEFKLVMEYLKDHPDAHGREIRTALGISRSESAINRWIRYIHTHKSSLN